MTSRKLQKHERIILMLKSFGLAKLVHGIAIQLACLPNVDLSKVVYKILIV